MLEGGLEQVDGAGFGQQVFGLFQCFAELLIVFDEDAAGNCCCAAAPTRWPTSKAAWVAAEKIFSSGSLGSSHRRLWHCQPEMSLDLERRRFMLIRLFPFSHPERSLAFNIMH